jgi:hypothetical protein
MRGITEEEISLENGTPTAGIYTVEIVGEKPFTGRMIIE